MVRYDNPIPCAELYLASGSETLASVVGNQSLDDYSIIIIIIVIIVVLTPVMFLMLPMMALFTVNVVGALFNRYPPTNNLHRLLDILHWLTNNLDRSNRNPFVVHHCAAPLNRPIAR